MWYNSKYTYVNMVKKTNLYFGPIIYIYIYIYIYIFGYS